MISSRSHKFYFLHCKTLLSILPSFSFLSLRLACFLILILSFLVYVSIRFLYISWAAHLNDTPVTFLSFVLLFFDTSQIIPKRTHNLIQRFNMAIILGIQ